MRHYQSSRALVIGIDAYTAGWPRLDMAVADARVVAQELESRGFDVTLRTNLNSADLDRTLKEFFAIQGANLGKSSTARLGIIARRRASNDGLPRLSATKHAEISGL